MGSAPDVLVVGGGLSGLCCALHLQEHGLSPQVLETADEVGGRVRTDLVEGFRLDRGFQVLLAAYPEARRVLDYGALDLRPFRPGALVHRKGRFERVGDPWRRPQDALASLLARVGTLGDKLAIARLRATVRGVSLETLLARPETTIEQRLRGAGFSEQMVDAFFRPLFGGITLDTSLSSSSRVLEFVFRMMAEGPTCLPAQGMGAIPRQIADRLAPGVVCTGARVESAAPTGVVLAGGRRLEARAVVIATDGSEASRLTRAAARSFRGVACLYFAAPRAPIREPLVVLDGDGRGPVTNLCVPSNVAPTYAPAGPSLVSATVIGVPAEDDARLEVVVRHQLEEWFGRDIRGWRHLRTYRIPHALPDQPPRSGRRAAETTVDGLYVCGDGGETASIHGAMASGRVAAEAVADALAP